VVCGTPERRLDGEAERATRRSKGGGGTGVFLVGLRLGLGHGVIQGLFCRAAGSHWRAGPGKRSSLGISGRRCAPGKKGEREGRRNWQVGTASQRERGKGARSGWAALRG
jgi:hypothetical protein